MTTILSVLRRMLGIRSPSAEMTRAWASAPDAILRGLSGEEKPTAEGMAMLLQVGANYSRLMYWGEDEIR